MNIKTVGFFARKRSGIGEKERAVKANVKNTIPIIVISASLSFLTHTTAAASKHPTYRLHGALAVKSMTFDAANERITGHTTAGGKLLSLVSQPPAKPAAGATRFSPPDYRVIYTGDPYFAEESSPVERGKQQSAGLRYASSRKIGPNRAAAGGGGARVSENRQPKELIPLPISGSVMLLLIGTCLILLAGLGMKTYRRIISKI